MLPFYRHLNGTVARVMTTSFGDVTGWGVTSPQLNMPSQGGRERAGEECRDKQECAAEPADGVESK